MQGLRQPVLFVGHGSPMNAILDNKWSQGFRSLAADMTGPRKPKAILAVSAHWYIAGTATTGNENPPTIHDFGGFPPELYAVQYPAAGAPALAQSLAQQLAPFGAQVRGDWGLDHGTWSVVRHMFPKADVPIAQLSIDGHADAQTHWAIGESLRPLREQGVLVLGSGNAVHNLPLAFRKMRSADTRTESWAQEFDEGLASAVQAEDKQWLTTHHQTPLGRTAHPTPDHYLPVVYATAAAGPGAEASFPVEGFDMGDISMRCIRFD